jgi:hypothetical protein
MSYYKSHSGPIANAEPKHVYDYKPGMPLLDGHFTAMEYCPKQKLTAYKAAWKAWMVEHGKDNAPYHVKHYMEMLRREGRKTELLSLHQ